MGKLIYTSNIGYDMRDWENESIQKVFAGTDCIMAITEDGRVFQKTQYRELEARTKFWTRIHQIAISKWASCAAIGLVSDGTCMISKRPIRKVCLDAPWMFEQINQRVKSWTNIVQVAASDAFFALDSNGFVHYAGFHSYAENDYKETKNWRDVRRIVTGTQCSIFGITSEGKILCAGANLKRGPHGDISKKLNEIVGAVDIYATGSECGQVLVALNDGTLVSIPNTGIENKTKARYISSVGEAKVLDGHFAYQIYYLTSDKRLCLYGDSDEQPIFEQDTRIIEFAVGDCDYGSPFVIAVTDEN